nr:hypothetical protein BaRGS_005388 [Batillaria attramentaria]
MHLRTLEITAKYKDIWRIQQVFLRGTAYNNDVGSTKPVDCGGTSRYGPFGMLGLGAHAAMEVNEWPYMTDKGYVKIKALWVPPNDFENILRRRTITIDLTTQLTIIIVIVIIIIIITIVIIVVVVVTMTTVRGESGGSNVSRRLCKWRRMSELRA